MKRALTIVLALVFAISFTACEKAPFVTMTGPRSFTFTREGGTQSFTFTCNREWSVSSSESWIRVSPSSGSKSDNEVTVTITCSPNTTYDPRNATITVRVEELTETISVTQETGLGLLVSPTTFDLTNAAQDIEIEVQKNVQYAVTIDDACKDWISQKGTKALSSEKVTFAIAANETYDNREGKITFKQTDGDLVQTVTVKQSQADGLFVSPTKKFNLSDEAQSIELVVNNNVSFDVVIPDDAKEWVSIVSNTQTKSLTEDKVVLAVSKNETDEDREALVVVKQNAGPLSETVSIKQKSSIIEFEDPNFKAYCLENFDTDHDQEISLGEAKYVEAIRCNARNISSLSGIEHFIHLVELECGTNSLSNLDLSSNKFIRKIYCSFNNFSSLSLDYLTELTYFECSYGNLSHISVANCSKLDTLSLFHNNLEELDVTHNKQLRFLAFTENNLHEINIENNVSLERLECYRNQLTKLDVRNNKNLKVLSCMQNQLTSLDVSNNVELDYLSCDYNQLTSLDVDHCKKLTRLNCVRCALTGLDVSNNTELTNLDCSGNEITTLNVRNSPSLYWFDCGYNKLTEIDVTNNPLLEVFTCRENEIHDLNLNNNSILRNLDFSSTETSEIDLQHNTELQQLYCSLTQLEVLDVSNNLKLRYLGASSNKLKEIWLKQGQNIERIDYDPQITEIKYKN